MDHGQVSSDIERVVASSEAIQKRVAELAQKVGEDYRGRDLLLVGVLKGAVMLMADLSRALASSRRNGLDGSLFLWLRNQIQWCGPNPERFRSRHYKSRGFDC